MLLILSDMVKQGELGRLDIVNLEARPEIAKEWDVRSVPWVRIGMFELTGLHGREQLRLLIERAASPTGMADHFHDLLRDGELAQVLDQIRRDPGNLAALLPIVANPEASINVRIGAGVVFEEFSGHPAMQALAMPLGELTEHADARVRADACHYLGMTGTGEARIWLTRRLQDEDANVREIAAESLEALQTAIGD
ncbi:MAG: HEAT repeat domain-containing protein [Parasulfuritortus sp.]|nr:HEAT repeat domain-containing protein [Parasulfuritortus sp.]